MSREESKKAAKELLALCEKEGVKVPTDPMNAMVQAGTMLNATKEDGKFQIQKALEEMINKFGQKASPVKKRKALEVKEENTPDDTKSPKKKTKRAKKTDEVKIEIKVKDEEEDEEAEEKPKKRSKLVALCEKNQELADAFAELSGFEFKRGEKFKGGAWSKVAKAIRESEDVITSGKQATKLKGIGKSSAAKIEEFLETGTIHTLEEFRAGNM